MIIENIRLKNIKSYGEGPDGNGVTVPLQGGVNRIAGRNGHGKTTLIEAVGYALFLSHPIFEENFQIDTYFLSHGAKTGEIGVTFQEGGQQYMVERGIGKQSKLKAKVIQTHDGSICAEGDKDVEIFLCKLLDFPDAKRLEEMFTKLVGVKQGRLNWPFDSKPAEARKFFEPLMEVAIFRDCFESIKPVADRFKELRNGTENQLGVVRQIIVDRADSPLQLAAAQTALKTTQEQTAQARIRLQAAQTEHGKWIALEKALQNAESAKLKAEGTWQAAQTRREHAEQRVLEARDAADIVAKTAVGHAEYQKAEQSLKELEEKQARRDALLRQRDQRVTEQTKCELKATGERDQIKQATDDREPKTLEQNRLAADLATLDARLVASKTRFETESGDAEKADNALSTLRTWIQGLPPAQERYAASAELAMRLAGELDQWSDTELETARATVKAHTGMWEQAQTNWVQASQRRKTMSDQLQQINGGVCPFLKEPCKQFDPAKIKQDLTNLDAELEQLKAKQESARNALDAAKKSLDPLEHAQKEIPGKRERLQEEVGKCRKEMAALLPAAVSQTLAWLHTWDVRTSTAPEVPVLPLNHISMEMLAGTATALSVFVRDSETWAKATVQIIRDRLKDFAGREKQRAAEEQQVNSLRERIQQIGMEIERLNQRITDSQRKAEEQDRQAQKSAKAKDGLEEQLKPFAELDKEIQAERQHRDQNKAGHEQYLSARKIADELPARDKQLEDGRTLEAELKRASDHAVAVHQAALGAFDSGKLQTAKEQETACRDEAARLDERMKSDHSELNRQDQRHREWQDACRERDRLAGVFGRHQAAIDLTELARTTLRDAAPAVAQHLCDRIAAGAQRVFNQINPEPLQLAWDANHYSLRIAPGDRRFAMLSGGEQTKLALAVTLAMIEEFSSLRFCIFDEPTYGVDADSRSRLADAILSAQAAARLEQLLLVSHDDAFEGKIEHSILLQKTASGGSAVAMAQ